MLNLIKPRVHNGGRGCANRVTSSCTEEYLLASCSLAPVMNSNYQLFPHQEQALEFVRKNKGCAFLAMEMRLGKTLVAIKAYSQVVGPKLVVGPTSVLNGWQHELTRERLAYHSIYETSGSINRLAELKSIFSKHLTTDGFFLINYEGLRACPEIAEIHWAVVILDESTAIKNPKSEISKLCTVAFYNVPNRMCLSGNPAPESAMNWYQQMLFIKGFDFMGHINFWEFRNALFQPVGPEGWDWVPKSGSLNKIKSALDRTTFFCTRKQANLGNKKIREKRID